MPRPSRSLLTLASVLALVTTVAGCGARLSEEQTAAVNARVAGAATGLRQAPVSTLPGGGGDMASLASTATGNIALAGPSATSASGGAGGDALGATGGCVPSGGATDVGVSDTEVKVADVTTITGPVPGLGTTGLGGVRAYFAYRNSQGGVCGRKLTLVIGDDRFDAGVNRAATQQLMNETLGFVNGWSVVDDGGASVLAGTNVPDVTLALGDARRALPNNFSANPITPNSTTNGTVGIFSYFKQHYGVSTAAVVWGAQNTARNLAQNYVNDIEAAGITVKDRIETPVTETNYVGVAQKIKNSQDDLVITALEINGIARLASAFQQVGYFPKVPFYGAQTYGEQFIQLAGSAANGSVFALTHAITEDAPASPIVQTMVDWYRRANPNEPIDYFSFMGWTSAHMFATALQAAGPQPTRDKMLAALSQMTNVDADGLVAGRNPAAKQPGPCFVVVTVENQTWKRVDPAGTGFVCP